MEKMIDEIKDEENEDIITFNKYKVENELEINKKEIFILNKNLKFSLLPVEAKTKKKEKYFVDIKNTKEQYIGILTSNFKKETFGYILFKQNDEYLGEILNEKKNGFGIYKFNNGKDIYIGYFENNNICGEGIYINDLKIDKSNKNNLTEYICNIGTFNNGEFQKGKIYTVNNNIETLEFLEDEKNLDKDGKEVVNIEKKDGIYIFSKGIMKDKIITEGNVIYFKENNNIENKFYFKLKNGLEFDFIYNIDEKKEKMLAEEFNKSNFVNYRNTVQSIFNKIEEIINEMKNNFKYAKELKMGVHFKEYFLDYFEFLLK